MAHKIYGQQVLVIGGDNPIIVSTPEEMANLLTSDNVGKFVKYIGETGDFEVPVLSKEYTPVNPINVDDTITEYYFNTQVVPDFNAFNWDNADYNPPSPSRRDINLVRLKGSKYNANSLTLSKYPQGNSQEGVVLSEEGFALHVLYRNNANYIYISTDELAAALNAKYGGDLHVGWLKDYSSWNTEEYGTTVQRVKDQNIWGSYASKDGQWTAEVINTNLSLVKDAFYKISEETDIVRYYELPALSNEGTAADLAEGKELINSNGEKVVGTASGGGGQTAGDFWVKVIDYDGTVLLEKRGNNGDSFDLPSAPSHEGLVFQEWSASCPITDGKVVIDNNNIMAGAVYTTASGQNEFDITLTKVTGLAVTLNMDGTKDWGDGTSDTNTTHTYTAYGDYTIKCNGTTMTTSNDSGLFGQSSSATNYYCTAARFATVATIKEAAFRYCYSLTTVVLSNGINSIYYYAFASCRSLTSIVIPRGVTSIGQVVFGWCYSLTNVILTKNVTTLDSRAFHYCYSLTNMVIPIRTRIGSEVFNYCYSLTNVVIPKNTSIGVNAFSNCFSLTNVIFAGSSITMGQEAFASCYSLTNIVIPNITNIEPYVFQYCFSLTKYDFSQCSAVPTLSNKNAFSGINKIAKIIVPDSLYDEWIAKSNWSTYANYIYKASEVTA